MIEFDTDGTKCAMCIGEMTSGHLIGLLSQKRIYSHSSQHISISYDRQTKHKLYAIIVFFTIGISYERINF